MKVRAAAWVVGACLVSGCGAVGLKTREVPTEHRDADVAAAFSLPDASGETISLDDLLAGDRIAVLVFYRGHW